MSDFAKIDQVKAGTHLRADDGFDCLTNGQVVKVEADEDGDLFIPCGDFGQKHYLAGQVSDDKTEYVGLYLVA